MSTIWQQNASTFASRPQSYIDQERRAGLTEAMGLILQGRPGYALFKLARSVERQNRIDGNGTVPLPICAACGTVCGHKDGAA